MFIQQLYIAALLFLFYKKKSVLSQWLQKKEVLRYFFEQGIQTNVQIVDYPSDVDKVDDDLDCAVIVFDLKNAESFEDVEFFSKMVKDMPITLIGAKNELEDPEVKMSEAKKM